MYIKRHLAPLIQKSKKSILLLGPRQCGKSTLIRRLAPELEINLADEETFVAFLKDPGLLKRRLGRAKTILLDEVQRIPSLLNTVQSIVDADPKTRFFLTGSSATKLRRGKANLLPGRILSYQLGPLSISELGERWDLDRALSLGLLPEPFLSESDSETKKLLRTYATTYLREEIQAEALTRNLEGFSRFFEVIASRSGDWIDFSKYASQAMIERTTAQRYFETLCDTLVVERVDAFAKSAKRRLVQHPRFFFFDVGVLNGSVGNFVASSDRRGALLEHLFLQTALSELRSHDRDFRVTGYRTEAGAEVDFIFEIGKRLVAVEVKATRNVDRSDMRGLKNFSEFCGRKVECLVAYLGEHPQQWEDIQVLPFKEAVLQLID